jgi:hypothetical protein
MGKEGIIKKIKIYQNQLIPMQKKAMKIKIILR